MQTESLMEKINSLPLEKLGEVEDFVDFLALREKTRNSQARHAQLAAYAAQFAGTEFDLNETLEQASLEHLLSEGAAEK